MSMLADPVWQMVIEMMTPDPKLEQHKIDPAAWVSDKISGHLWSKQREIMASLVANRRTAVKSCHGAGKSFTAGAAASWWIDTHPAGEAFIVSTAPSYPQVHAILWEEIRKNHRKGKLPGRVLQSDEWKMDNDTLVGYGRKPADTDEHGFQGIHRRYVLVILDEACGIPDQLWTAVEAITTNSDCRILAIGNPDDPNTAFSKNCNPGSGWNVIQISAFDTPNFTQEPVPEGLRPMLVSEEWVEDARKRWGEDSPLYQSKVLGEFPEASENTLIPVSWITAAQERTLDTTTDKTILGVDVARFGTDRSIVYQRAGGYVRLYKDWAHKPTTETTGEVIDAARETWAEEIHVDGVGVGGGVVDMLAENGWPVQDMQAGSAPMDRDRFINIRAEWYWDLRMRFESGDIDLDPNDDELAAQLSGLRFFYDSRGRVKIESKDDMKKRGMPSPDRADAVMLAFARLPVGGDIIQPDIYDAADARGFVVSPY